MQDYNIEISKNAFEKLKHKSGLNKKAAIKVSKNAYKYGIKHSETSGNLYRYMSSLAANSNKGTDLRLYGDKAFIFNKNTNKKAIILVTVIQLPNNISKKVIELKNKLHNNMEV